MKYLETQYISLFTMITLKDISFSSDYVYNMSYIHSSGGCGGGGGVFSPDIETPTTFEYYLIFDISNKKIGNFGAGQFFITSESFEI